MFDPEWLDEHYKDKRVAAIAESHAEPQAEPSFNEEVKADVECLFDTFGVHDIDPGDFIICYPDGRVVTQKEDAETKQLESSSYLRFYHRLGRFKARKSSFPRTRHAFWWVLHNCIAHIGIGLVPIKITFQFHDWTSKKLNTP